MHRIAALLVVLTLSGCAASVKTSADTSYRADDFSRSTLATGGIAILPVVAGQGSEGYRRPFGRSIDSAVDSLNALTRTGANVLHWTNTMQLVNDAGLIADYQQAVEAYRTTSVIDSGFIARMSEVTETRYMLFLVLGDYEQDSSTSYNFFAGTTDRRESAGVSAFAQVWDAAASDVVWEGAATVVAKSSSGNLQYMRESQRDPNFLSRKAAEALATELFTGQ